MKTTLATWLENKYSSSDLISFISYIIFKQMYDKLIYHLRLYSSAQFQLDTHACTLTVDILLQVLVTYL